MAQPKKKQPISDKRGNGRGSISKYKSNRYRWQLRDADSKTLASGITDTKTQVYRHVFESEKLQFVTDLFPDPIKPRVVGFSPLN